VPACINNVGNVDIPCTVRVMSVSKQVLGLYDIMKAKTHTHCAPALRKGECYTFIDEKFFT
jgi:hypothetical protein